MARVAPAIILCAGVGASANYLFLCEGQSEENCRLSGVRGACFWAGGGVCERPVGYQIHPFDGSCKVHDYVESTQECEDVMENNGGEKADDMNWLYCEQACNRHRECKSFTSKADGTCSLCTSGRLGNQNGGDTRLNGNKVCSYCADFGRYWPLADCPTTDGCVLEEDTCQRHCDEKPYDSDGSCSNFCHHEYAKCSIPASTVRNVKSAAECETLCTEHLPCDAYAFAATTGECVKCGSDELVDTQHRTFSTDPNYWLAGKRTCTATTTPATATSATATLSVVGTTIIGTTIMPTESMVDPAAASVLAKRLISKSDASEVINSKLETVEHSSALVVAGGLVVGVTTTASLILMAGRSQSSGSADGYSAAEC